MSHTGDLSHNAGSALTALSLSPDGNSAAVVGREGINFFYSYFK
jgi:hypothetical protein